MRASVDSAPTAVVRTSSRPSPLTEPPVTRVAFVLRHRQALAGDQRLVDCGWRLRSRSPSTGTRSPGRTTTRSPGRTLRDRALRCSCAVAAHARRFGRSAFSARIASVVWRLARASSHLPSSTSVMTTAEASKYRWASPWPPWSQQQVHAQAIGGRGAERDQQVHVAGAGLHGLPARAIEARAQPELDRRRQGELQPTRQGPVHAERHGEHRKDERQRQQPPTARTATIVGLGRTGGRRGARGVAQPVAGRRSSPPFRRRRARRPALPPGRPSPWPLPWPG